MKKTASILTALLLCFLLAAPAAALDAQDPAAPEVSAPSAVLIERETGTVLYAKDETERRPPASVTKVMTLLLIAEAVDSGELALDDMVTASERAASMGGSQIWLEVGEQLSVSDMIKCVAVVSANDCAVALAEHLCGSEAAFVERMNRRAQELGMKDTAFVNCTGLPAAGHHSSAYDIALMSRELILHHPDIRTYTTIWMDSIRDGAFGLTNTNRLVRFYPGATGLKTGSTDSALYCLSATAERDGMELIAVVMKAPSSAHRFDDAKALLDYGFSAWSLVSVYPDSPLAPIPVLLGTVDQIQPQLARDCRLLVRKGQEGAVTTRLTLAQDLEAPVEPGQTVGELEVSVDGQVRDTVPILAAQGAGRLTVPRIFTRLLRQLLMAG